MILGGVYLILSALGLSEFVDARSADKEAGVKVVGAAALFFLALIFEHVSQIGKEHRIEIFGNESEAEDRLKEIIANTKIEEAKFLEYSAASPSVVNLLKSIINSGDAKSIRLLLYHPRKIEPPRDNVRTHRQINRILSNLENLSDTTYQDDNPDVVLRIKCYEEPASLRGRNFNNKYVALGWYTYDHKKKRRGDQIWGAENPLIVARGNERGGGEEMKNMFNIVFEDFWSRAVPLKKALDGYQHWIDADWLDKVSQLEDTPDDVEAESDTSAQSNGSHGRNTIERLGETR